ncbi:MAG: helix-hairpin-helix domain-containing protein [Planctomycetaceae bacterium]|nr:helix-hairpin-helix domain-containing protein [Planctomycetaceae bacterium]
MEKNKKQGSALIMTIVLTVLLASVAVMFVAIARMDKASTSNIFDSKMLDTAAQSVIEIINKELVYDTPGVAKQNPHIYEANSPQYFDYKDYPDPCDAWLASSEPYCDSNDLSDKNAYKWRQISDVTGYLARHNFQTRNINVKPVGLSTLDVVKEYPIFGMDPNGHFLKDDSPTNIAVNGVSADADGDGIADAKWFEISNLRTPTGRVFAAVRIIDNGAMANVNTAYKLDPNVTDANKIDGSSQMHINLAGLLKSGDDIDVMHTARCGSRPTNNDTDFQNDVVCDFNNLPLSGYLPFDSSDELELRYRFCINSKFKSRFEVECNQTTNAAIDKGKLYNASSELGLEDWTIRVTDYMDPNADRRHLLTTYNCDRLIDPNGNKMLNINEASAMSLYKLFKTCMDSNYAGQIAVDIIDSRDADSDVNVLTVNGHTFYGFEKPCIYISEIAYKQVKKAPLPPTYPKVYQSYAIELYRPYGTDMNDTWYIYVEGEPNGIEIKWLGSSEYHAIRMNNSSADISYDSGTSLQNIKYDPPFFSNNKKIFLMREIKGKRLLVDFKKVPVGFIPDSNNTSNLTTSLERDITKSKCIRRIWQTTLDNDDKHTLGKANEFFSTDPNSVQAYPADKPFTSVGEIGMILREAPYSVFDVNNPTIPTGILGLNTTPVNLIKDWAVKVDIADANLSPIFNYLTAVDTRRTNETRVKGRININTAPFSVIAQLPWVSQRPGSSADVNLAQAIVAYRDSKDVNGFKNIGQLMQVPGITHYASDTNDLKGFPDLTTDSPTTGDGAENDYEERDVIFARISNLATVRSDIFTAYILVRVGTDGPQKRYIAILDRSEVKKPTDKVKIRAFQYVPDAR